MSSFCRVPIAQKTYPHSKRKNNKNNDAKWIWMEMDEKWMEWIIIIVMEVMVDEKNYAQNLGTGIVNKPKRKKRRSTERPHCNLYFMTFN